MDSESPTATVPPESIGITVTNPTQYGSGLTRHTRYCVGSQTSLAHFPRKGERRCTLLKQRVLPQPRPPHYHPFIVPRAWSPSPNRLAVRSSQCRSVARPTFPRLPHAHPCRDPPTPCRHDRVAPLQRL